MKCVGPVMCGFFSMSVSCSTARGSAVKNLPADARRAKLIPALGRSPGEENSNLF